MPTRFYIESTAGSGLPSPTPTKDAAWETELSSGLLQVRANLVKTNSTTVDLYNDDSDSTNLDVCFIQAFSYPLTAGQTITGSQALKSQFVCSELSGNANCFLTVGIRCMAADGSTVRKEILPVTRDNLEIQVSSLVNRQFTATSASGDYTTVSGDYLEFTVGVGGDPATTNHHDTHIIVSDDNASDLPENNSETAYNDYDPWIELADTLTEYSPPAPRVSAHGASVYGQVSQRPRVTAHGATAYGQVSQRPRVTAHGATVYGNTEDESAEGPGEITFPVTALAGTGQVGYFASGSETFDVSALAGSGVLYAITGTGDVSPAVSGLAASGWVPFTGTGSVSLDVSALAGTGAMQYTGTGGVTFACAKPKGWGNTFEADTALRFKHWEHHSY